MVVFGPEAAQALLGATTLQLFNLAADPTRERLVHVRALLKQLRQKVKLPTARLEAIAARQAPPSDRTNSKVRQARADVRFSAARFMSGGGAGFVPQLDPPNRGMLESAWERATLTG